MILNDEAVEYVLENERQKEDKTIFLLKEMDSATSFLLLDKATEFSEDGKIKSHDLSKSTKIIIEQNLVGWKNLKNKKGLDIEFSKDKIYLLPLSIIYELVSAIEKLSSPSRQEIKN